MKILFFDIRSEKKQNIYSFPISSMHIISIIRNKYPNIEYDIYEYYPESKKEIKDVLSKKKYDVFLFSFYLWNMNTNLQIIKEINKLDYGKIIVGGRNINFFEEFTLEHLNTFKDYRIDFFVRGPAETSIINIFDYFHNKINLKDINNIVYYQNNKYYKNFCDKKSNFSYFSYYNQNEDIVNYLLDDKKKISVEFSYEFLKGCPFKCSFCAYSNESNSKDFNDINLVKKDLFFLIKKSKSLNINTILFFILDANFGIDDKYYFKILKFLNVLKRLFKVKILLIISMYKNINEKALYLMNYMIDKGFTDKYYFAVQTFSEDILKANKRSFNPHFQSYVNKIIQDRTNSSFTFELVLGLNKQTKKDFINDLKFLYDLTQNNKAIMNVVVYNLYLFPDIEIKKMFSNFKTNLIKNTIYYVGKYKKNKYFENENKTILIYNDFMNKHQLLNVRNFLLFYLFFNKFFSNIKRTITFNDLKKIYFSFFINNKIIKKQLNFLMKEIFWNNDKRKDYENAEKIIHIYYQIFLLMTQKFSPDFNDNILNRLSGCFMTLIPIRRNKIYYINKRKKLIERISQYSS